MVSALTLRSRITIDEPLTRLRRFCAEEYAYYDAVEDDSPDQITPVDVAITIAVNSFVNTATRLRGVQRGLAAACNPLLAALPTDASLDQDITPLDVLAELLRAAVTVPWVLVPVATKVLHRKRRSLVPMLDQIILEHYLDSTGNARSRPATQDKRRAADAAMLAVQGLREDLLTAHDELETLTVVMRDEGCSLTRLRVLDILVWTEVEPQGYYRTEP